MKISFRSQNWVTVVPSIEDWPGRLVAEFRATVVIDSSGVGWIRGIVIVQVGPHQHKFYRLRIQSSKINIKNRDHRSTLGEGISGVSETSAGGRRDRLRARRMPSRDRPALICRVQLQSNWGTSVPVSSILTRKEGIGSGALSVGSSTAGIRS